MPEFLKTVTAYRCTRCRWEWVPKAARRPMVCPHCKSPYWDKEREQRNAPKEGATATT